MSAAVHRDDARRFVFGLGTIAVLIVVAIVGGIVQTGGALPGKRYTYVTAAFKDVGILKTGKEVRTGGVRVGTVSDIEYQDGHAVVMLRLDGDRDVYADATAFVGNVSALGKKYVDLDPGSPSAGALGADGIPLDHTTPSSSVEDVLAGLDRPTLRRVKSVLAELSDGLIGHGDDLHVVLARAPELLSDVKVVTRSLSGPGADLPGTLESADQLLGRFRGREQQIADLLDEGQQTMDALAVDDGAPLQTAVGELPVTLQHARSALDALYDPLADARVAVRTLRPGGKALGKSAPSLRAFLRNAVDPLEKVPGVADQAGPAVDDLTDTLADARPLLQPVDGAVSSLATLLFRVAPYAGDIGHFFSQHDLLSGTLGSDDKHYFAAMLTAPGLFSVGALPDPLYGQEAYPVPGTAWNHSTFTDVRH